MTGHRISDEAPLVPQLPPVDLDEPLDGAPPPASGSAVAVEFDLPTGDLKRSTALSILWTIVRTSSDYFLSFVVFALLARKLGPAAFGVYALAVAFAEF